MGRNFIRVSEYLFDGKMSREKYDKLLSQESLVDDEFILEEALVNLGRKRIINVRKYF